MRSAVRTSTRSGGSLTGSVHLTAGPLTLARGGPAAGAARGGSLRPARLPRGCRGRPRVRIAPRARGLRRLGRGLGAGAGVAGQRPPAEPLAGALRDPRELVQAGWPGGGLDMQLQRAAVAAERAAGPEIAAARKVAALLEVARQ